VPGDADYSPLWAVHVYDRAAFDRVHDAASATAAPVVRTRRARGARRDEVRMSGSSSQSSGEGDGARRVVFAVLVFGMAVAGLVFRRAVAGLVLAGPVSAERSSRVSP
jgi:hypothetical protein